MESRVCRLVLAFILAPCTEWNHTMTEEKGFPKSFSSMGSGYSDSENNFECHKDLGFSEIA